MAITDENSVLILGAGTSVLFGMPLGGELMEAIRKQIDAENQKLEDISAQNFNRSYGDFLRRAVGKNSEIHSVPINAVLFKKFSDGNRNEDFKFQKKRLGEILSLLSNQTSETIDDFIVENPSYAELIKICIASIFFKTLYKENGNLISLKSLEQRDFKKRRRVGEVGDIYVNYNERNWIHLLINIVRQGIRSGQVSEIEKIKIVTFNYDMILEKVLEQQFSNSEKMKDKNWNDYFEIIHPHGKCSPLLDTIDNAVDIISKWADGIFVVQENESNVPKKIIDERNRAKEIVMESHEVYAAGFSFAAPNCRILGMTEPWHNIKMKNSPKGFDRHFRFCNYDGNYGISRTVKKFERKPSSSWTANVVDEQAGTPEKPLRVADWIRMGVLGELPG